MHDNTRKYVLLAAYSVLALSGAPLGRKSLDTAKGWAVASPEIFILFTSLICLGFIAMGVMYYQVLSKNCPPWIMPLHLLSLILALFLLSRLLVDPVEWTHVFVYASLTMISAWVFAQTQHTKPFLKALLFGTAVGATEEIIQAFIPSRVFDTRDLVLNCSGACLAMILINPARMIFDKK